MAIISPEEMKKACLEQFEAKLKPDRVKNYNSAYDYASEVSRAATSALCDNVTRDALGGFVPQEYADEAIYGVLESGYNKVSKAAQKAHRALYMVEDIGLNPLAAEMDEERAVNLVNAIVNADNWHDINALMTDSASNFIESAVPATLKKNVQRESELGFNRQIRRDKHSTKSCTFCDPLCDTFDYESVPEDFWKRHRVCSCTITPVNFTAKREWAGNKLAREGK